MTIILANYKYILYKQKNQKKIKGKKYNMLKIGKLIFYLLNFLKKKANSFIKYILCLYNIIKKNLIVY